MNSHTVLGRHRSASWEDYSKFPKEASRPTTVWRDGVIQFQRLFVCTFVDDVTFSKFKQILNI